MTTLQNRIAFTGFKEIMQTLYDMGCRYRRYAKAYHDGEDYGTATNNAFVGRQCLDFLTGIQL